MRSHIPLTEAVRSFSEILNRVQNDGESFVVERNGSAVCEIIPMKRKEFSGSDLANLLRSLPKPDGEFFGVVEDLIARQPLIAENPWQD